MVPLSLSRIVWYTVVRKMRLGGLVLPNPIFFLCNSNLELKKIVGDGSNPGGDVFSIH